MTMPISAEFLELQELLAGRYSIERELGRGGMGIVLLARDVALDRPVAIKLLPPHLATRPDERERFLQEARTAAGLSHPNIVPIHLVEARGELVFFVMGFVDGETLRDRVEQIESSKDFRIGEIDFHPFTIPHDAVDNFGFTATHNGVKVATLLDFGHVTTLITERLRGCAAISTFLRLMHVARLQRAYSTRRSPLNCQRADG